MKDIKYSNNITYEIIESFVLSTLNINIDAISGKTRKREVVEARQFICYFCRDLTKLGLSRIGKLIGNNKRKYDHSTVLHGHKTIDGLIDFDKDITNKYNLIHQSLVDYDEYRNNVLRLEWFIDRALDYKDGKFDTQIKGLSDKIGKYELKH